MEEEQGTRSHLLTQKHTKRLTGSGFKARSPLPSLCAEFQSSIFFSCKLFPVNIFKPLKAHRRIYINIKILATLLLQLHFKCKCKTFPVFCLNVQNRNFLHTRELHPHYRRRLCLSAGYVVSPVRSARRTSAVAAFPNISTQSISTLLFSALGVKR